MPTPWRLFVRHPRQVVPSATRSPASALRHSRPESRRQSDVCGNHGSSRRSARSRRLFLLISTRRNLAEETRRRTLPRDVVVALRYHGEATSSAAGQRGWRERRMPWQLPDVPPSTDLVRTSGQKFSAGTKIYRDESLIKYNSEKISAAGIWYFPYRSKRSKTSSSADWENLVSSSGSESSDSWRIQGLMFWFWKDIIGTIF